MMNLLRDTRFGFRLLLKNPGFAAVAVLALALGIGANTAIFTLMHAIMLKSLPVADPQRLVRLGDLQRRQDAVILPKRGGTDVGPGQRQAREQPRMEPSDAPSAEEVRPMLRRWVARPQRRAEFRRGEVAVRGQVQIAIFPGHLTQGPVSRLAAAQEGGLGLGKLFLERMALGLEVTSYGLTSYDLLFCAQITRCTYIEYRICLRNTGYRVQ